MKEKTYWHEILCLRATKSNEERTEILSRVQQLVYRESVYMRGAKHMRK